MTKLVCQNSLNWPESCAMDIPADSFVDPSFFRVSRVSCSTTLCVDLYYVFETSRQIRKRNRSHQLCIKMQVKKLSPYDIKGRNSSVIYSQCGQWHACYSWYCILTMPLKYVWLVSENLTGAYSLRFKYLTQSRCRG